MIIQLQADRDEQELVDAYEAICDLVEQADEIELPPAAIGLLVALGDAVSDGLNDLEDAA